MNFSVVKLTGKSFDEILKHINGGHSKTEVVKATIKDNEYQVELKTKITAIEGFKFGSVEEEFSIGDISLRCTGFNVYTERPRKSDIWLDERNQLKNNVELVNPYTSDFLVYEYNQEVFALGLAGINRVKALLKDAFLLQLNQIIPQRFDINEDFLYWLFKRFIDTPSESLIGGEQLYITSLDSYVGKTRDNVNAMRGEGDGISIILGTLAFLFNNEELKSIRPTVQYGEEKILFEIGLTGTFKVWPISYRGKLFRAATGIKKEFLLTSYISLILIPILVKSYRGSLDKKTWSTQLKIDFIKRLGERIMKEVQGVLIGIEEVSGIALSEEQSEMDLDEARDLVDDDEEILPLDEEHLVEETDD